jgi:PAS domain-containing protein
MHMLRRSETAAMVAEKISADRKRFQDGHIIPVLVVDAQANLQDASPAARSLLEYRPDQPLATSFFSMVHPKNLHQVMRDLAAMVCNGKAFASWLLRMRTGRSQWRWYRATVRNLLNEPGGAAIQIQIRDLHHG